MNNNETIEECIFCNHRFLCIDGGCICDVCHLETFLKLDKPGRQTIQEGKELIDRSYREVKELMGDIF